MDAWVVLAALWGSRFVTGSLDASRVLFGFLAFVLVSSQHTRRGLKRSALDDAGPILARTAIAYAAAAAFATLSGAAPGEGLLILAFMNASTLIAGRAIGYALETSVRLRRDCSRALIVGSGEVARRLVGALDCRAEYGLEVVGVVYDDGKPAVAQAGSRALGPVENLEAIVDAHQVSTVFVAFGCSNRRSTVDALRALAARGVDVWVVPRLFELGRSSSAQDDVWGVPVERIRPPARADQGWVLKRALDVVGAFVGVVLLAPVMVAIAVAIHLDSGGPVLLRQPRLGFDGRRFFMWKFRTMTPAGGLEATEWTADERRTTRVGQFLRKTSLDELPQLFNVLRGEMSLVGPRPERPYFVELFGDLYPSYPLRHRLPAGITGWAQVHGLRGDTSIEDRATFDNYYIENWSLGADLRIICRTLISFIKRL